MSAPRGRDQTENLVWPHWVPIAGAAMPLALAYVAAAQRDALAPPRWPALIALAAAAPWLIDAAMALYAWPRGVSRPLPRPVFAIVVIAATAALVAEPAPTDFAPFFLVLLAAESAALMPTWHAGAVTAASMGLMWGVDRFATFDGALIWLFGIACGHSGGFMVGRQMTLTAELRAAQTELARKAAAEERQRIAREVHDVVAHSLTVTMLHISAARLALPDEPQEAAEALAEAERVGRQSLNDIRRTVGLLGEETDPAVAPLPGTADLEALVRDFRQAGLDVRLEVRGEADAVPAACGLAIYRIAQESLVNAARHAPGALVEVLLDATGPQVGMRIRNGPSTRPSTPSPGSGRGLEGIRDRAGALGGSLRAGPEGDGWTVELKVPRDPQPA